MFRARVGGLSDQAQAVVYMLVSCIVFTVMWAIIRHTSESVHPALIIFYRTLFGVVVLLPTLLRGGKGMLRVNRLSLYLLRGLFSVMGLYGGFFAVTLIPLADVVAITYAAPLFVTVGAILLLGERLHWRRILATIIGFIGVMIVLRPGAQPLSVGVLAAVAGTLGFSGAMLTIKVLSRTEKPETIVAYAFLMALPVTLATASPVWQWPDLASLALLILIGVMATVGQVTMTRAFALGEATAILPLDFSRLLLAVILGTLLFGDAIDGFTITGGLVILAATVYTAHREARLGRKPLSAGPRET